MCEKTGAGGALHRPNVYIRDILREERQRLDVQLHGQDDTLGHSHQPVVPRRAIPDVELTTPSVVGSITTRLQAPRTPCSHICMLANSLPSCRRY